jgi:hexosaminidase
MIFPRLAALAEAAWAVPANKDLSSFENKLKAELQLYAHSHIYYYDPFNPGLHPEPVDFVSQNQE